MEYLEIYLKSMGVIFTIVLIVFIFSIYIGAAEVSINKSEEEIDNADLKKEVVRLRKQLAKNHNVECSCSFCKPQLD